VSPGQYRKLSCSMVRHFAISIPTRFWLSVIGYRGLMSVATKFFEALTRLGRKSAEAIQPTRTIPTVSFNASHVTNAVKADIRRNILLLEIHSEYADRVYDAAVRSVSAGRDLSLLYNTLIRLNISGMTKRRAEEIARLLNNRATALMDRQRQESLGITQAVWLYSGAPCEIDPKKATGQDAAHRAANGQSFDVRKGLLLNGKRTWPGVDPGCRCASKSIIHGFP